MVFLVLHPDLRVNMMHLVQVMGATVFLLDLVVYKSFPFLIILVSYYIIQDLFIFFFCHLLYECMYCRQVDKLYFFCCKQGHFTFYFLDELIKFLQVKFQIISNSYLVYSISGMAVARDIKGRRERIVAVISNWTTMAGQVYEAMSNAGCLDSNLVVILNDSRHSLLPKIDEGPTTSVSALSSTLSRLQSSKSFRRFREAAKVCFYFPSCVEK